MDLSFSAEQQQLKDMAARLLAERAGSERMRQVMASDSGYDRELWTQLCGELGWAAMVIPEQYEGLGLGPVELTAVMEEMGRALYCGPFFASVCLGARFIQVAGSPEHQARYLPGMAAGTSLCTLALAESGGGWDPAAITTTATPTEDGYVLEGHKAHVPEGHVVDSFVVVARLPGSRGRDGLCLFVVPADAQGLTCQPRPTVDQTRRQAHLVLEGVSVATAQRLGAEGQGAGPLDHGLALAAIALAAEQVGGAQQCLDVAVEYAKTRQQFGRPIGSFQAVKHICADMMTRVESARSTCYHASALAAAADADPGALLRAAAAASSFCADAYFFCAAQNIQIHGGMGFTWEHDAHLHFKRARSGLNLLGDPKAARELLAASLLD